MSIVQSLTGQFAFVAGPKCKGRTENCFGSRANREAAPQARYIVVSAKPYPLQEPHCRNALSDRQF